LGYFDQGSIFSQNSVNLDRYNLRSNIDVNLEEIGLNIKIDFNATLQEKKYPYRGSYDVWHKINVDNLSGQNPFNPDGTYSAIFDHPMAILDDDYGYRKYRDKQIISQLNVQWQVPKVNGLILEALANYSESDGFQKAWSPPAPQYTREGLPYYGLGKNINLDVYSNFNKKSYLEGSVTYKTEVKKHTIDAKLLGLISDYYGERLSATRRNYLSTAVDQLFAGPNAGQNNDGVAWEGANMAVVGRLKYDFASKYILEGNFRYDGTDNFAPSERWGFFPSISAAWVLSEESFMESMESILMLSFLKLRASKGKVGLMTGAERFGYLFTYNLVSNAYFFGDELKAGFEEGRLVDPLAMSWFNQESNNFGMEAGFFDNKLMTTVDYFYYRTTGFLMSPSESYTTPLGKTMPMINSNSALRRAGIEFDAQYQGNIGEFSYSIGGNLTKYDQLWETLATEDELTLKNPLFRVTHIKDNAGRKIYTDGFFDTPEEMLNSPRSINVTDSRLGDIKYIDQNGDGKIDDYDRIIYGKPGFPHFIYGVNFSANFKGFSLAGLIQGTGDRYEQMGGNYSQTKLPRFDYQLDYWRPDNLDAKYPRISNTHSINNELESTYRTRNLKYVRLKTLSLGYDLTRLIRTDKKIVRTMHLALTGHNLLTFSRVMDYIDPESTDFETGGYPIQKVYAIKLTCGF